MNPEAISGIKATSRQCGELRSLLLKQICSTASIGQIFNESEKFIHSNHLTSACNDTMGISVFLNGRPAHQNDLFAPQDIITVSIALKSDKWPAECSFSYSPNEHLFIESNRRAVTETAESLCPGLPFSDIRGVLEMSAEGFNIEPEDLSIPLPSAEEIIFKPEQEKGRLKAGSMINIKALFSRFPENKGKKRLCRHSETVLITGNGAEILTIS